MIEENIRKALEEFERKLLESQKDLPEEFQKVLNDNIWDLYDYDDEKEEIFLKNENIS